MRADFLGCPIDILTIDETIAHAVHAMRDKTRRQHVALNVAKFVNMRRDPVLRQDVTSSDIVGIDGMGIVLAARLLGLRVKQRVAGIDLFMELMDTCAKQKFRPFLLGAKPEILQKAAAVLKSKFPGLQFAGLRDGYFSPDEEAGVVEQIVHSGADCLFIAMLTPRKERFLARYRDSLGVPFIMGIGGTLDVVAGYVNRAPKVMQSAGLEWLYRVYQEPGRMWWRYTRTNTLFLFIIGQALLERSFAKLSKRERDRRAA